MLGFRVKIGDAIRRTHLEPGRDTPRRTEHRAAATTLQKASETTAAGKTAQIERAPAGAKPGMTAMSMSTIVATVLEVDTKNRLLTVQGPKGNIVTVVVPADVKAFDSLKKGDKISAEYGEAVAVSVRTPEKKK